MKHFRIDTNCKRSYLSAVAANSNAREYHFPSGWHFHALGHQIVTGLLKQEVNILLLIP